MPDAARTGASSTAGRSGDRVHAADHQPRRRPHQAGIPRRLAHLARGERDAGDRRAGQLGGRPWVIVVDAERYFHLDADKTRQGVRGYLHSVEKYGDEIAWTLRKPTRGARDQVTFGPHQLSEHEFYLAAYGT